MRRMIITLLVVWTSLNCAYAEFVLNFYTGNVSVETAGKKTDHHQGMVLSNDTVIITGRDGTAAVYDSEKNSVITIKPGTKVKLISIYSSGNIKPRDSVFGKFKGEKSCLKNIVVAVRAEQMPPDYGEFDLTIPLNKKRDWSSEWEMFQAGDYGRAAAATAGTEDPEGRFIHGASLYYQWGIKKYRECIEDLEPAAALQDGSDFKTEADRLLAVIYFELGRYDLSYRHILSLVNIQPENEIAETSFYIMVISSINTGNRDNAKKYLQMMKTYYPGSQYLSEIDMGTD